MCFCSPPTTVTVTPSWQVFYKEVIVWKRLQHPNIVPFLGVPAKTPPFEIVCGWMENGTITEYVRKHPDVDRVCLVSGFIPILTTSLEHLSDESYSCGTWQTAFTTFTHAT